MDTNAAMWALVVGFLSPPVLAVIQQTPWKESIKAVVTFLWSVVLGVITAYFAGQLTAHDIIPDILIVLVTAISTFKGFWKPQLWMTALERTTSYWPKTGPRT